LMHRGSMPVHRLQSLLKLPIGDRLIAEAIFGHLEIGRPFLEATLTDLAEGFGMAARRRIRARHAAMTVFDASKKYAVRPSDSCGNKLTSHKWSSTLWRNEWGANQADSSQTAHMCQARRRVRSITALSQELVVRGMGRPMVYRAAPSWHPGQALASYPGSVRRVTARSSVLMPSSMSRRWPRLQPAHMHGVKERCPGAILPLRGERE